MKSHKSNISKKRSLRSKKNKTKKNTKSVNKHIMRGGSMNGLVANIVAATQVSKGSPPAQPTGTFQRKTVSRVTDQTARKILATQPLKANITRSIKNTLSKIGPQPPKVLKKKHKIPSQ